VWVGLVCCCWVSLIIVITNTFAVAIISVGFALLDLVGELLLLIIDVIYLALWVDMVVEL